MQLIVVRHDRQPTCFPVRGEVVQEHARNVALARGDPLHSVWVDVDTGNPRARRGLGCRKRQSHVAQAYHGHLRGTISDLVGREPIGPPMNPSQTINEPRRGRVRIDLSVRRGAVAQQDGSRRLTPAQFA